MSFQPFDSYVATDNQWFRRLPKHWCCFKLKRLIADVDSGTSVNASDEPAEQDELGVLKTSSVYTGEFRASENKRVFREEYDRASCQLQINTLIVSRMNTPDLIGAAGLVRNAPENLFLPDRLWQVSFNDAVPAFMHYWTLTGNYRGQVKSVCTGTSASMKNLTQEQFGNLIVGVPPKDEQKQIASFLDYETAKIDALIEKQQQLIALLGEKRQAVISHAVTKGLNPDAPMRDSGVEWLGEVPSHWETKCLKFGTTEIQTGPFGSLLHASDYVSGGIPLVNPAHMVDGKIVPEDKCSVDPATQERLIRHQLRTGDLVCARRGELGRCAVVETKHDGWLCGTGSLRITLSEQLLSHYAYLLISSDGFKGELSLASRGSTMENLNPDTIGSVQVPVPPVAEQEAILKTISEADQKMDALESLAERQSDLLQERRTALISAAVTGKIDVRGWKRPSAAPKKETEMEVA